MQTALVLDEDGMVTNCIVVAEGADPTLFGAVLGPEDAGFGWCRDALGNWTPPAIPIADARAAKLAAIVATADALLSAGAPRSGLHISVDDGSRADLTAMAATASAALAGAVAWPESYARGWITTENERIPLATPAEGLTLAATVGDWYARLVQRRRDLKDAVLAAATIGELDAIDIDTGWPD